jgi:hypothetical protein
VATSGPTYIDRLERFFRHAAELELDKDDLRRHADFIHRKTHDLLLRGEANARANGRDVIEPQDLPITKGLQECMQATRRIDDPQLSLEPILEALTQLPPLKLAYGEATTAKLPEIVGGLSYALAKTFKIIDPKLKHPHSQHWEAAFQLFDLLL